MYNSVIWRNATTKTPSVLNPIARGWELMENMYKPLWFEGDHASNKLADIVIGKKISDETHESGEMKSQCSIFSLYDKLQSI